MNKLQKGDLVKIELSGSLVSDGSLFESTDEKEAKDAGIWSNASKYGPRLVIFGKGAMIAGIEEELSKIEVGKEVEIIVPASKAFGEKHQELVRVMPEKEFASHGVRAQAGLMVTIDGVPAMVKSASSGRIMLDFNHPLAGQDLKYKIKLLEIISEPEKKAHELAAQFGCDVKVEGEGKGISVILPKDVEASKRKGLEAALKASLGEWAKIGYA
ncbi:peptidylprolyl isomerase [Candidatus Micrarchaeota archaeon CG10_big_fil_rev_8_21_14_0_10_45_29]|nr:MAG: peptidylprolyl isomerase [Candidatus Micrarchaeota archaeon CG10_big_fil_rev_8_21_14_0_10_45_29]